MENGHRKDKKLMKLIFGNKITAANIALALWRLKELNSAFYKNQLRFWQDVINLPTGRQVKLLNLQSTLYL